MKRKSKIPKKYIYDEGRRLYRTPVVRNKKTGKITYGYVAKPGNHMYKISVPKRKKKYR